jgi:hypothetical protein
MKESVVMNKSLEVSRQLDLFIDYPKEISK